MMLHAESPYVPKALHMSFDKVYGYLETMIELNIRIASF